MRSFLLLAIGPSITCTHAAANDSTAELATGGLILTKNDDIELQSEDLYISAKQIRVQYRFFNKSDRDITTKVAFPMPDLAYEVPDMNVAIPTTDPQNVLAFATTVNNRPVTASIEQKAFVSGADQTSFLKQLGIDIGKGTDALKDVPRRSWDELIRRHLAEIEEYRNRQHLAPRWTLKTTFYWEQTFPAKQVISIDHQYLPSVGGTVPLPADDLIRVVQQSPQYCIDRQFINAVNKGESWEQHYLSYILSTGANWSGPIREFRLVIDKGRPGNLVSFCGSGIRRISPTQFEMRSHNYVPKTDLYVLILTPAKSAR